MSVKNQLVDLGESVPFRFPYDGLANFPITVNPNRLKLSEFVLFVAPATDPSLFNIVELNGQVVIQPSGSNFLTEIRLEITRTLTSDPLTEVTIYETRRTVSGDGNDQYIQIDMATSDVGSNNNIPEGYYAYASYISKVPLSGTDTTTVIGHVTLSGISYVKNLYKCRWKTRLLILERVPHLISHLLVFQSLISPQD